jgi:hypothetical protein
MLDCGLFLFGSKNSTLMFAVSWVKVFLILPAFAESPVRKDGGECEKGIRRSLGARPPQ